jgi:hypothetical protein
MKRKTHFEDDSPTWNAEFSKRLAAYQQLVDTHHAREKQFEEEKQAALEALRSSWLQELKGPEEQLLEVAPIFADDVDAIPTRRAAYSDRTAAMMAKIAMLAYITFEEADKKKIRHCEGAGVTLRRGSVVLQRWPANPSTALTPH